jgi:hypothetical protein
LRTKIVGSIHTEWRMLKGERNHVLDTFEGVSHVIPRESLGNNNFDAAEIVSSIPIAL